MKTSHKTASRALACLSLAGAALVPALLPLGASAQGMVAPTLAPPQNVLHLSASGSVEVQQDLLSMTLSTTRDGADPAAVQAQLKTALDAALAQAKAAAQPGQLDVRTGNFSLYPRNNRDGKITGWQGSVELVLEGRDFQRITTTAGRITTLTMGGINFGLSREQRAKVETEAQSLAIANFRSKAAALAGGFGFANYSLRDVTVSSGEQGGMPRPRMMAMEAKMAMADAPVPVEAGKSTVVVTVSGAVQLQ